MNAPFQERLKYGQIGEELVKEYLDRHNIKYKDVSKEVNSEKFYSTADLIINEEKFDIKSLYNSNDKIIRVKVGYLDENDDFIKGGVLSKHNISNQYIFLDINTKKFILCSRRFIVNYYNNIKNTFNKHYTYVKRGNYDTTCWLIIDVKELQEWDLTK